MKLPVNGNAVFRRLLPKLLWAMRLSFIILLLAALHVSAACFSQSVSISGRNMSLSRIFEEIKSQTGYNFFYDAEDVGRAHPVSLNAAGASLTSVLDECFRGQDLTYRIVDRIIVVKAVAAPRIETPAA